MRTSKHLLIVLMSIAFVCGAVGVLTPTDSPAGFKYTKKKSFPQAPLVKKWFQKTVCGFRNPGERFVTSKDGKEVCDRTTGDIWEQNPASPKRDWGGAKAYCAELDKGNGKVYELPTLQQLVSVLNYLEKNPAVTPGVFSNVVTNGFYWSASEVAGSPTVAWGVGLGVGNVEIVFKGAGDGRVWCMRRDKHAHADW